MIPLKLTAREQDMLAEMCAALATVSVQIDRCGYTPNTISDCGERIAMIIDEFGVSSQQFGTMYDRLHRTGANS